MKKLLTTASLTIWISLALGQYSFKAHYFERNRASSGANHSLELTGNYALNSSAIDNQWTSAVLGSDFLGEDLKTHTQQRLRSSNALGFGFGAAVQYKHHVGDLNLTIGYNNQVISGNEVTRNLFELVMFGNAPFAGQNLDLSGNKIDIRAYQALEIGWEKSGAGGWLYGAALNGYLSTFDYQADLKRGVLWTDPEGSQVQFDPEFELTYTDTDSKNGLGLGLDAYAVKKYGSGLVIFQVEDLGFISHPNQTHLSVDSSYSFDGIEIEDIFNIQNENFDLETDSLHKVFGVAKNQQKHTRFTPMSLTIGIQELLGEHLLMEVYANYRFITAYAPQVIVKPNVRVNKNLSLAPVLSVGGFGHADLGLSLAYHHHRFYGVLDVMELENLLAKKSTSGRGIYLKTGLLF